MLDRRQFVSASFGAATLATLAACGNANTAAEDQDAEEVAEQAAEEETGVESQTLIVAASPSPHAEILEDFAAPLLAEQGIELEVREYTDYIQPNVATSTGEVDANYFQHINYLSNYNEENDTDLVSAGMIHYEPFGVYSSKHDSLDEIADGAVIAIPNDPTNEGRALLVLQQEELITLTDPEDLEATPKDIADNPHNIEFQELEAAALPRALDDVDYAVINGNYAIEAGLHVADAVAVEANDGKAVEQYGNIICTTPDKLEDERIIALVDVLQSDAFADYLAENYDQDVLPAV